MAFLRQLGEWRLRIERNALAISLLLLAVLTLAEILNSFGLDEASDTAIAKTANTFTGPFYTARTGDMGRDRIALALLDQASLDALGADGLPLSYAAQLQLAQAIARYRPSAIFLDFTYQRPRIADRDEMEAGLFMGIEPAPPAEVVALAEGLRAIEQQGIAVYIGPVADHLLLRPLTQIHQVDLSLPVNGYYDYIFQYSGSGTRRTLSGHRISPAAVELFRHLCTTDPALADIDCVGRLAELEDKTFYLSWGMGNTPRQLLRYPRDLRATCPASERPWSNLANVLWSAAVRKQAARTEDNIAERCSFHDTLPVAAILSGLDAGGSLDSALRGKVVMVGADMPGSDRWPAPFYNEVPGIAVHAMALDNLVGFAGKVPLVPGTLAGIDLHDLMQVAAMLTLLLLFFMLSRSNRFSLTRELPDGSREVRRVTAGLVIVLLAGVGLSLLAVSLIARWPLAFVFLTTLAPSGLGALALMIIGRFSCKSVKETQP
ncbi:CHASE2 domain-containing protein [Alteraurantiacibacter palmitatis]|uniref:CHASE2 domain-containing protein n=1 Tax=Alteraurantiacibacter palmitatis TaxID=2054628 RepID=A0ABV7E8Q7_9SPHN